jgi:hypothetical protein
MPPRPVSRRHWRSYGNDPPPTGEQATWTSRYGPFLPGSSASCVRLAVGTAAALDEEANLGAATDQRSLRDGCQVGHVSQRAVTATPHRPSGRILRVEGGRGQKAALRDCSSGRAADGVARSVGELPLARRDCAAHRAIMTTTPNAEMSELHDRTPVRAAARRCCVLRQTGCCVSGRPIGTVARGTTGRSCWRPSPHSACACRKLCPHLEVAARFVQNCARLVAIRGAVRITPRA